MRTLELYFSRQLIAHIERELSINLKKQSRIPEITYYRYICFTVIKKKYPALRLSEIGSLFNKTHSTVVHGLSMYEKLKNYSDFKVIEDRINQSIASYYSSPLKICNHVMYPCNV